jgi:hypothetical protein
VQGRGRLVPAEKHCTSMGWRSLPNPKNREDHYSQQGGSMQNAPGS